MRRNASILVISDQHFPYNHADIIAFLKALNDKYKFDKIVNIGDEIDGHSFSFHSHDPNLLSPGDELRTAIDRMKPLYELFPKMDIVDSNHGSLVYRKGKHHGLPRHVFKSYREILEAPRGWKWHYDLTLRLPNGQPVYFHHGKSANGLKLSQAMGMCVVQGHHHEKFAVEYWSSPVGVFWSMQVGCLIEFSTLAFEYARNNLKRPMIGCGVIIDGQPKLEPMLMKPGTNRWTGRLAA
jgi:hypothetical protein